MPNHRVRTAALALAIALTFGALPDALGQSADVRLTGSVVDARGEPVANVTVTVARASGGQGSKTEAATNKKGRFVIPGLPHGRYVAGIGSGDFVLTSVVVEVRAPDGPVVATFKEPAVQVNGPPQMEFPPASRIHMELVVSSGGATTAEGSPGIEGLRSSGGKLQKLNALFEQQQWPELLQAANDLLAADPEAGGAHYLKAVAQWKTGDFAGARSSFERAKELIPEQPGLTNTIATMLLEHASTLVEQGKKADAQPLFEEAAVLLQELAAAEPTETHLSNLVAALEGAGRTDDAIAALSSLIERDPTHRRAYHRLAQLYTDSARPEKAAQVLETVPSPGADTAELLYNAAVELWNAGRMDETLVVVERAIGLDPAAAIYYRLKGRALISKDENEAAIEALEQAIRTAPEDPASSDDRALIDALRKK